MQNADGYISLNLPEKKYTFKLTIYANKIMLYKIVFIIYK